MQFVIESLVLIKSPTINEKQTNFEGNYHPSRNRFVLSQYERFLQTKATITQCDLSPRFFVLMLQLLCEFESDKIGINEFEENRSR